MRILESAELRRVAGGRRYTGGEGELPKQKGNNGYGNGGEDGVPGRSGETGGDKAEDLYR